MTRKSKTAPSHVWACVSNCHSVITYKLTQMIQLLFTKAQFSIMVLHKESSSKEIMLIMFSKYKKKGNNSNNIEKLVEVFHQTTMRWNHLNFKIQLQGYTKHVTIIVASRPQLLESNTKWASIHYISNQHKSQKHKSCLEHILSTIT